MTLVFTHQTPYGLFETYNQKPDFAFNQVKQTHSSIIMPNDKCLFGLMEADGIIQPLNNKNPVAIKTADCMPILLSNSSEFVFLHAGWKGLAQGIAMQELIKKLKPNYAFIGPSIQVKSFIVTEEFSQHFKKHQHNFINHGKYYTFDLQKTTKEMLLNINPEMVIEDCALDTYDIKELQSFRRDKSDLRNWNIFYPKKGVTI